MAAVKSRQIWNFTSSFDAVSQDLVVQNMIKLKHNRKNLCIFSFFWPFTYYIF